MRRLFVSSLLILSLFVLLPQVISAHTSLQSSLPEADAIVTEELKEVILEFSTEVEPLSSFKLVNEEGNEVNLEKMEISEDQIVGILEEVIPNGVYTLEWKIVGRDGHPIQGEFNFTVNVTASQNDADIPLQDQQPIVTPAEPEPSSQVKNSQENVIEDTQQELASNQIVLWIVGAIVAIALLVIVYGVRRKK